MSRWLALIVLFAAACRGSPRPAPPPKTDAELLRTLSVLATSRMPTPDVIARKRQEIDSGKLTIAAYVDELLATNEFARDVAPLIVLRQFLSLDALAAPRGSVLEMDERRVYYLREPCKPEQAVSVVPWWHLLEGRDEPVSVCPDAYRPTQWMMDTPAGIDAIACRSFYAPMITDGNNCGCGPNLIRCYSTPEQKAALRQSMREELRASVAENVSRRAPISNIFTSNETFRDRNAELLMRMFAAEAAQQPIPAAAWKELASWPATGKWAPREDLAPGQNAGILTAPQLVHYTLDRRQRMSALYDALWCMEPDSVGATPESMLSIAGADLQIGSDGWKELAARPVCTSCHARLDYGFQFFWGFPNGNVQAYFVPGLQKAGRGPLYANDIDDPRGDAELTPQGFATLAVSQPEFRHCMARDFTEYVLGSKSTPLHVAAVEATLRSETTATGLMRAAMLLLVQEWGAVGHPEPQRRREPARPPPDHIALTGARNAIVQNACIDCHDHEEGRVDLSAATIARKDVVAMLESVATGVMPKQNPLTAAERREFLETFIDAIWSGEDAVAARTYFLEGSSIPVYRPEVAFALIHRSVGTSTPSSWRMVESSVRPNLQQLTPGFATVTGLEAIAACSKRHEDRAARRTCISDAIRLDNLTGRTR